MLYFCLHNSNRNEVIRQQSLNFGKNRPEQTTESLLVIYYGVLHSKELFYTVYLQCDLFHSWFFVICPISAIEHVYLQSCPPCHVWD